METFQAMFWQNTVSLLSSQPKKMKKEKNTTTKKKLNHGSRNWRAAIGWQKLSVQAEETKEW